MWSWAPFKLILMPEMLCVLTLFHCTITCCEGSAIQSGLPDPSFLPLSLVQIIYTVCIVFLNSLLTLTSSECKTGVWLTTIIKWQQKHLQGHLRLIQPELGLFTSSNVKAHGLWSVIVNTCAGCFVPCYSYIPSFSPVWPIFGRNIIFVYLDIVA